MKGPAMEKGGARGVPLFTWGVVAVSALALLDPAAAELSRGGLREGQIWRFWTGHLAHYSLYHFAVDAGAFLLLGLLYERRVGSGRWALLTGVAATSISAVFLSAERGFETYRGLSGLDCAAFAAAVVAEASGRRLAAWLMGAVFAAKLAWEQLNGAFMFPSAELGSMGLPVLSAHTTGAAAGFATALIRSIRGPSRAGRAGSAACATRACAGDG